MKSCVLVTGATSGVGASISARLHQLGLSVIGTYFNGGKELDFSEPGPFAARYLYNVHDLAGAPSLLAKIHNDGFVVTSLVNCAGDTEFLNAQTTLTQMDQDKFLKWYNANFTSVYGLVRAVYLALPSESNDLTVVNVSSTAAKTFVGSNLGYIVAKHSLIALSEFISKNYKNIRINNVLPGLMRTKFTSSFPEEYFEMVERATLDNSLPTPDDVADIILSVLQNPKIVNQNIIVDNGVVSN